MAKKPSAETEVKRLRAELKRAVAHSNDLAQKLMESRGQRTKAEQQAAEWRLRFDALLARVPVASMREPEDQK